MQQNILTLKEAVSYQDGSVVSKEILKTAHGTVTIFAFAAGQGLSEHTAPFKVLVQILDGQAQVIIDKTPHLLAAGQMIELPADVPHSLTAIEPFKMLLVMIK